MILLISLVVNLAKGGNYYVKNSGLDTNNGTTPSTPFNTIAKGVSKLNAGDTLNIMEGTYFNPTYGVRDFFKPQVDCAVYINEKNGTINSNIVVRRYKNDRVILKGDGLSIVLIKNSSYIKFEGFEIIGEVDNISLDTAFQYQFLYRDLNGMDKYRVPPFTPANIVDTMKLPVLGSNIQRPTYFNTQGITVNVSDHIVINKNYVHHLPGEGMRSVSSDYITFSYNEVHNSSRRSSNGVHGLSLYTMKSIDDNTDPKILIYGNYVHDNYNEVYSWSETKDSITPHIDEGKGITVQRCTREGGWTHGFIIIENNVSARNGFAGVQINDGHRVVVKNNTIYKNQYSSEIFNIGTQNGISIQKADTADIYNNIVISDYPSGFSINAGNSSQSKNLRIDKNLVMGNINNNAASVATNTINNNPQMLDPEAGLFKLKSNSPGINMSNSSTNIIDFYGRTRSGIADLGAIEYLTTCNKTVTNQNDNGSSSLRDALSCAIDGDTILFDENLVDSVFLESSLILGKKVVIKASSPNKIIIQSTGSNSTFPLLTIGTNTLITLSNINLKVNSNQSIGGIIKNYGRLIIDGIVKIIN